MGAISEFCTNIDAVLLVRICVILFAAAALTSVVSFLFWFDNRRIRITPDPYQNAFGDQPFVWRSGDGDIDLSMLRQRQTGKIIYRTNPSPPSSSKWFR